jgi:hypothetical protein
MGTIGKRLTVLEAGQPAGPVIWHRVLRQFGQNLDEALDAYGRDRIAPTDRLIVRQIIDVRQDGGRLQQ